MPIVVIQVIVIELYKLSPTYVYYRTLSVALNELSGSKLRHCDYLLYSITAESVRSAVIECYTETTPDFGRTSSKPQRWVLQNLLHFGGTCAYNTYTLYLNNYITVYMTMCTQVLNAGVCRCCGRTNNNVSLLVFVENVE